MHLVFGQFFYSIFQIGMLPCTPIALVTRQLVKAAVSTGATFMPRIELETSARCCRTIGLVLAAFFLVSIPSGSTQDKTNERVRPSTKVNQVLDRLDQEFAQRRYGEGWARTLRELIQVGPDAVPELIAELDATDSDIMLRNLGFVLRAIGDKRAIPALIRAFPKTLREPGSDMGLRCADQELLAFMQKHDLNSTDRGGMYSFGRPVREIGAALRSLSGTRQGEEELNGVMLEGSARQQHLQRQIFYRCAQSWQKWWEKNWREHVTDVRYALVRLPSEEPIPVKLFPSGEGVTTNGVNSGYIAVPDDDASARGEMFYDLDTGRAAHALPDHLKVLQDDPYRLDRIQDWAAQEGFDLMGTMYQAPGSEKRVYAIRGLGLTAWEIDPARYESIDDELKKDAPLTMGRPAAGLLLHYDADRNEYDPTATAAFLFLTRESTYGILFVGV
jgi:hypothetical protein